MNTFGTSKHEILASSGYCLRFALLLLLVSADAGCANLSHGSTQSIQVVSDPPGAQVTVDTDPVPYIAPATITLKRGQDHVLLFRKAGYDDYSAELTRSQSAAVLGNFILGGMAGLMTDYSTGAAYDLGHANLVNDTLTVYLRPQPSTFTTTRPSAPLSAASGPEPISNKSTNLVTQKTIPGPQPVADTATQPRLSPHIEPTK